MPKLTQEPGSIGLTQIVQAAIRSRHLPSAAVAVIALAAATHDSFAASAAEHKGYRLTPVRTGASPDSPYSASVDTSVGRWTLEYSEADCNIHSTCDAALYLTKPGAAQRQMAVVSMVIQSTAVLSPDFKKIWTDEITGGESGVVGVVDTNNIPRASK
jgi:hypothetical protein